MVYLVIMVAVAAAGITRLWLQQRKLKSSLSTVDGFRESLERIATDPPRRSMRPVTARRGVRPTPLDPERREAALLRIEARRRARATG